MSNTNDEIELSDIQNIKLIKILQFIINEEIDDLPVVIQIRDVTDQYSEMHQVDLSNNSFSESSLVKHIINNKSNNKKKISKSSKSGLSS